MGEPAQRSERPTKVTVTVVRNKNSPVFQNEPYTKELKEDATGGAFVQDVRARDQDTRVNIFSHMTKYDKYYILTENLNDFSGRTFSRISTHLICLV